MGETFDPAFLTAGRLRLVPGDREGIDLLEPPPRPMRALKLNSARYLLDRTMRSMVVTRVDEGSD